MILTNQDSDGTSLLAGAAMNSMRNVKLLDAVYKAVEEKLSKQQVRQRPVSILRRSGFIEYCANTVVGGPFF